MPTLTITEGRLQDLPDIRALLHGAGLDSEVDHLISRFFVTRENGRVVGCAALEEHDGAGLLRSVAVDPAHRGRGLAHGLVTGLIQRARVHGLTAVYLLTDTAAGYFARHGFHAQTVGAT